MFWDLLTLSFNDTAILLILKSAVFIFKIFQNWITFFLQKHLTSKKNVAKKKGQKTISMKKKSVWDAFFSNSVDNVINATINNSCFTEKQLHQLNFLINSFLNLYKLTNDISCIKPNQQLEPQKLYPIFTKQDASLILVDTRPRHRPRKNSSALNY